MNKQGPKGITWTNYTWNPITGCTRNCWYCYVKRIPGYDSSPDFHSERLYQPLSVKKPSKIFVCSTGDFFDPKVLEDWRFEVYSVMNQCPQHDFQILTKCYKNLEKYPPGNVWVGVTIDGKEQDVLNTFYRISVVEAKVRFISFEPLLAPVGESMRLALMDFGLKLDWIIIGAMTGPGSKEHQPEKWWIDDILQVADQKGIPVFMKENLRGCYPHILRQEWPEIKKDGRKK